MTRPMARRRSSINIQAKVARMPQREIAANLNATQQASAAANDLDSIVVAFNQATGAAIAQIVDRHARACHRPGRRTDVRFSL